MTPFYLIYHPARKQTIVKGLTVHHDKFGGNEDPYIWNNNFLHTYCHITQLTNEKGQVNFWISGDTYPNFSQLLCDCVFVIDSKHFWTDRNYIGRSDPIVDNDQTFEHHYQWANPPHNHHHYKKRRRYTLKGDSEKSFQPQDSRKNLIDILPFLNRNGISTDKLINSITSKKGSRPFKLDNALGQKLYDYLFSKASIKLLGRQLKNKHPNRSQKTAGNIGFGVIGTGHC